MYYKCRVNALTRFSQSEVSNVYLSDIGLETSFYNH